MAARDPFTGFGRIRRLPVSGRNVEMRTLRGLLVVVLVAVLGFMLFGYLTGSLRFNPPASASHGVDTPGPVDLQRARERGAEPGEKVGAATATIQETSRKGRLRPKSKQRWLWTMPSKPAR